MPKKPAKNAFYFFMVNFREEQKKIGINYANMAEVAAAADPQWQNAPPALRSKFEAIAKKEKEKYNLPQKKFTSTGVSFAEIDRQEKELNDAKEHERKDINNLVKLRTFNNSVSTLDIFIMDVNPYCKAGTDYLIGEATLVCFNIMEGVKEAYHELINPARIPLGYASDVTYGSRQLGLEMPDDSVKGSNYMKILATIIDYLKQQDPKAKVLPPIFTMPDKVAPVQNFIHQLCRRAGEDDSLFRIYQLDTLFYTMMNAFKTSSDEGFPKESLAILQLKKDPFQYTPGIGCERHEEIDLTIECTLSRVKRWAYTILDSCCPIAGVDAVPGKHVPADFDLESIQLFQEQKKERLPPSVAGFARAMSSCNSSILNDSSYDYSVMNSSTASSVDGSKKEKRVHVPLRMPKIDYSQSMRAPPALTEDNFPSMSRPGRGRGSGSFSRLRLD